jgi:hypothetical protein
MLEIDGRSSHLSAGFDQFCKEKKIIAIFMASHSSPVTLLDWTGLGAPGAPMQIQFSKWIRSIPHFTKAVAARFTAASILVQCCCGTYVFGINYTGYHKPS